MYVPLNSPSFKSAYNPPIDYWKGGKPPIRMMLKGKLRPIPIFQELPVGTKVKNKRTKKVGRVTRGMKYGGDVKHPTYADRYFVDNQDGTRDAVRVYELKIQVKKGTKAHHGIVKRYTKGGEKQARAKRVGKAFRKHVSLTPAEMQAQRVAKVKVGQKQTEAFFQKFGAKKPNFVSIPKQAPVTPKVAPKVDSPFVQISKPKDHKFWTAQQSARQAVRQGFRQVDHGAQTRPDPTTAPVGPGGANQKSARRK